MTPRQESLFVLVRSHHLSGKKGQRLLANSFAKPHFSSGDRMQVNQWTSEAGLDARLAQIISDGKGGMPALKISPGEDQTFVDCKQEKYFGALTLSPLRKQVDLPLAAHE